MFRIVEAFLEAVETPEPLTYELIMKGTHEVKPGEDVVAYGNDVLGRFNRWWLRNKDSGCATLLPTYYGDQTVHQALERTTWHSAQHTRQLVVVLESIGTQIDGPLRAQDLEGLPLPAKAWDDDK